MSMKKQPRIRVAGVITKGDRLLVINHERDGRSYYLLPGGGVEWGETSQVALRREFMEELSLDIKVNQLLFVNESIEPSGKRHILNLTFKAALKPGQTIEVHTDQRIKGACWLDKGELKKVVFYPEIRPDLLKAWQQGFKTGAVMIDTPWH